MFSWNSRLPLRSPVVGPRSVALARIPGASVESESQSRPLTGSSCVCRGSTLPPMLDVVVLMSGASSVTVTDSCSAAGDICRFTVAC